MKKDASTKVEGRRIIARTGGCSSFNSMGWPPAVVIVVRHGARLDAADKQWHLTSPTPYDPPLTYGGWNQSRALGARIANILRTRETDDDIPFTNGAEEPNGGNYRKRRHKVIIHSSPFLRCVQTAVAISAGLGQNPGHTHRPSSSASKVSQLRSSPKIRPAALAGSPKLDPIQEPALGGKVNGDVQKLSENIKKCTIRVDAFLGEWLSPDYFELITPPPSSIMMVAGAKADLLRREDYSNLQIHTKAAPAIQGFPGGWGSPVVLPEKREDDTALSSLSSLAQALPRRDRTSSLSSMGSNGSRPSLRSTSTTLPTPTEHGIYHPPVPTYAISNSEPIPPGYVAHARDACVDVDYQWDSMREPQMWGNGGEYGEEWSSMHKRFRNGLKQMIHWYSTSDDPGRLITKTPTSPRCSGSPSLGYMEEEDEDTDLVIILVTHGAGCNALIGALTNQPVLLDVGMASLTMAVRKPTPVNTPTSTPGHSRTNSRNTTISDQYDVRLVANTEHLRPSATSTPSSSRTPSVSGLTRFREPTSNNGIFDRPARSFTTSGNFGSMRRTASTATTGPGAHARSYAPTRQSSMGLWSPTPAREEENDEPEDDMILNFGNENDGPTDSPIQTEAEKRGEAVIVDERDKDEEDDVAPLGGLWGNPRPPGHAEQIRETGHKRRWTVNERALRD